MLNERRNVFLRRLHVQLPNRTLTCLDRDLNDWESSQTSSLKPVFRLVFRDRFTQKANLPFIEKNYCNYSLLGHWNISVKGCSTGNIGNWTEINYYYISLKWSLNFQSQEFLKDTLQHSVRLGGEAGTVATITDGNMLGTNVSVLQIVSLDSKVIVVGSNAAGSASNALVVWQRL